jgi:DNA-binding HxlR family transcriptional regulator
LRDIHSFVFLFFLYKAILGTFRNVYIIPTFPLVTMVTSNTPCPISRVTHLIGEKWGHVVLDEVARHGEEGFNALLRRLKKVRPKILSQRLKQFEQEGLIKKKVDSRRRPHRSSYLLTPKGAALRDLLIKMREWHDHFDSGAQCAHTECPSCPRY